ncbi:MAG: pseudouridylate synthase [Bacteroidales bacterium]|jgi:3-hydroxymyristoyl/3-hydroxydecanoyl-(acyl carrier protein) dehydratase|nr:pseudouridylate synthase [Bacteroidales bacterium]
MRALTEIDVLELLPQRRPFVMIDRMLHFDMVVTSACLKIQPDNIFAENGVFTEAGIIESIAQTCAARMGYINMLQTDCREGETPKIKLGFIGAIKNLTIEKRPRVHEEIVITITVVSEILSVTLVKAQVTSGNEPTASCEMKIFLSDIDSR